MEHRIHLAEEFQKHMLLLAESSVELQDLLNKLINISQNMDYYC